MDTCRCSTPSRCSSRPGSASPSSGATAPARARCSVRSPVSSCRMRGRSGCSRGCAWHASSRTCPCRTRAPCSTSWPMGSAISARWSAPTITWRPRSRSTAPARSSSGSAHCSTSSKSATAGASSSASSSCSPTWSCPPTPSSTRYQAAGGGACCWRARWSAQPDVLLLDEPTNHLDIEAIEWLEAFLAEYAGAVVFVTHDRAFLQRLATRIVELDRGALTSWPGDYAGLPAQEGGVAGERGPAAREVRQEARGGRGLAAPRHQGAPYARRGARAGAARHARRARGAARPPRDRAAAGRSARIRPGRLVFEAEERDEVLRRRAGGLGFLDARSCAAIASG